MGRKELYRILVWANNYVGMLDADDYDENYALLERARDFFGFSSELGPHMGDHAVGSDKTKYPIVGADDGADGWVCLECAPIEEVDANPLTTRTDVRQQDMCSRCGNRILATYFSQILESFPE